MWLHFTLRIAIPFTRFACAARSSGTCGPGAQVVLEEVERRGQAAVPSGKHLQQPRSNHALIRAHIFSQEFVQCRVNRVDGTMLNVGEGLEADQCEAKVRCSPVE